MAVSRLPCCCSEGTDAQQSISNPEVLSASSPLIASLPDCLPLLGKTLLTHSTHPGLHVHPAACPLPGLPCGNQMPTHHVMAIRKEAHAKEMMTQMYGTVCQKGGSLCTGTWHTTLGSPFTDRLVNW